MSHVFAWYQSWFFLFAFISLRKGFLSYPFVQASELKNLSKEIRNSTLINNKRRLWLTQEEILRTQSISSRPWELKIILLPNRIRV